MSRLREVSFAAGGPVREGQAGVVGGLSTEKHGLGPGSPRGRGGREGGAWSAVGGCTGSSPRGGGSSTAALHPLAAGPTQNGRR